ncbi:MAG: 4-alpha-glucanotransferase [Acidobacteria bacterium]|nr:MAG: 4-alpha-glucanotransferase [Acidobacteriota bacterium]
MYPAPEASQIVDGSILIRDGKIVAVGDRSQVKVPASATRVDCKGLVVTAGFWNCHVHFSEPKWENAPSLPASRLGEQVRDMFARWGFTSVFDTGSLLPNTKAIAHRIEAREFPGPMILSAGVPFTSKDATPYYLKPLKLPELENPEQARAMARARLDEGADAIKIFQGAWVSPNEVVPMRVELVKAVAAVAHSRAKPLLAHPSDARGLASAIEGGVDVLTHLVEVPGDVDPATIAAIKSRHMAVIPTLKLFSRGSNADKLVDQLREFSDAGVQILFGTDVGFLTDYDPGVEYRLMDRAGLTFPRILASLTTSPAARYGFSQRKGRVAPGMDADLVVLASDPVEEVAAFTDVKYTLVKGSITFMRGSGSE